MHPDHRRVLDLAAPFVLFLIPAVLGPVLFRHRCREHQLSWLLPLGFGSLILFWACFFAYAFNRGLAIGALTYVFGCLSMCAFAAAINPYPDDDDDGDSDLNRDPDPGPINWAEFERDFWLEVERRSSQTPKNPKRPRTPVLQ